MRVAIGGLVGHVVDTVGLVRLAVGVHHGGIVSSAREAFFLAVPLLVTVSADDVGVGRGVVAGLAVAASRAGVVPRLELRDRSAATCSISCLVSSSQMISLASSGCSSALTAAILLSLLWSF